MKNENENLIENQIKNEDSTGKVNRYTQEQSTCYENDNRHESSIIKSLSYPMPSFSRIPQFHKALLILLKGS